MFFKLRKRFKLKDKSCGEKIIVRSSVTSKIQYENSKEKRKQDATCPECGHYELLNGGIEAFEYGKYYDLYTCMKCDCEWKIKKY